MSEYVCFYRDDRMHLWPASERPMIERRRISPMRVEVSYLFQRRAVCIIVAIRLLELLLRTPLIEVDEDCGEVCSTTLQR
jgi:hypothetical protein